MDLWRGIDNSWIKLYGKGRVDSESNFAAFRWHQWVQQLDLDKTQQPFSGEVGFAFVGYNCDDGIKRNSGRIGAADAPRSIRKAMANLPCCFNQNIKLFDVGDVSSKNKTVEESQKQFSENIEKLLRMKIFPIGLGGGHDIALGHYNGILKYLMKENKKPKIGIINFDAHFDIRPYDNGGSSGTMFRQIADICSEKEIDYSYMCLGIQKYGNTVDLFNTADKMGVNYILADDISDNENQYVFERLDRFIESQQHIYITICADVFAAAFAPGVSAPQPLGLAPEKVIKYIKHILESKKVISFDIAEVSPRFDRDGITARLASVIIFEVIRNFSK